MTATMGRTGTSLPVRTSTRSRVSSGHQQLVDRRGDLAERTLVVLSGDVLCIGSPRSRHPGRFGLNLVRCHGSSEVVFQFHPACRQCRATSGSACRSVVALENQSISR